MAFAFACLSYGMPNFGNFCKCSVTNSAQVGRRDFACVASNGAQSHAQAMMLSKVDTDSCVTSALTRIKRGLNLCADCSNGAVATKCSQYMRQVIETWCAEKLPSLPEPKCTCSLASTTQTTANVQCKATNGDVAGIVATGLNANGLNECVNKQFSPASFSINCGPCLDIHRAKSCALLIQDAAEAICK